MTNPPTEQDIAEVAKGLTKAQREAICNANSSYHGDLDRVYGAGVTRKALRERGLGHGDYCYLTPLGLAVRSHLLSEQTHAG